MPIFSLLDNARHIIFQSDSSNLHYFHQQISVLIVLNAHWLSDFLILANLVGIKCYLYYWCVFPWLLMRLSIFSVTSFFFLLWSIQVFDHFLNWTIFSDYWFFPILDTNTLSVGKVGWTLTERDDGYGRGSPGGLSPGIGDREMFRKKQLVWFIEAMAPHSSTLAWKIPWTEEPGRLQSMGLLGVRHN